MHRCVEGLLIEGNLVQVVTQNAQREDGKGQEVASFVRATEDARQDLAVVLCDDTVVSRVGKSTVCCSRVIDKPARATMLFRPYRSVLYSLDKKIDRQLTHFQKIGLNAIVAADTVEGSVPITCKVRRKNQG